MFLNGADARGTIYAVYSFSELFLDISPLWFWASQRPAQQAAIEVPKGYFKKYDPACRQVPGLVSQ